MRSRFAPRERQEGVFSAKLSRGIKRIGAPLRWRLGLAVADPVLEEGTDEAVRRYYGGRVTDCGFLLDSSHYERPRSDWVVGQVARGNLLEVGCGNGGMTQLLAPLVDRVAALDVSDASLQELRSLGLSNVSTVCGLVESYRPESQFDWIVASEVLEHLRDPGSFMQQCCRWLAPGGSLLLTTPNGQWHGQEDEHEDAVEHLHTFSFSTLSRLSGELGTERVSLEYIRDGAGRRRWLGCRATREAVPPTADDFFPPLRQVRASRRVRRSK